MAKIVPTSLPATALLARNDAQDGSYTDCFKVSIGHPVSLETFVAAFFDTWIFRLERKLLALIARSPSSKADVQSLARGTSDRFALWQVEAREDDQILLVVGDGPIRTWLMRRDSADGTALFFGSAVLPMSRAKDGSPQIGFSFRALHWFHEIYSRVLLAAAARKLAHGSKATQLEST